MKVPRCIRGLLLVVLTAGLRAAESPPPVPPGEDAITAAKRDYEVIKGTQSSLERQRLDLPAPGVSSHAPAASESAGMTEPMTLPNPGRPMSRPAKSANWLLDAMAEKKPEPLDGVRSGLSAGDGGHGISPSSAPDLTATGQMSPAAETKPGGAVDNPLAAYMSSWMTPHDLELLKDKSAEANPAGVATQPPHGGRGPASAGGLVPDAHANPYLVDLAPGLSEGPRDQGPAASAALAIPAPKTDLVPPKNQPPPAEQFKLQDDSKYFPQLKRF